MKEERSRPKNQTKKNPRGPEKRLYTVDEAAYYLGRTACGVRELIYKGSIEHVKMGRRVFLDKDEMDAFVERHKTRFTY